MEVHTVLGCHKHVCCCRCFMSYYYFNTLQQHMYSIFTTNAQCKYLYRISSVVLIESLAGFVPACNWFLRRLLCSMVLYFIWTVWPFFTLNYLRAKQPIYQFKRKNIICNWGAITFSGRHVLSRAIFFLSSLRFGSLVHVLCAHFEQKNCNFSVLAII